MTHVKIGQSQAETYKTNIANRLKSLKLAGPQSSVPPVRNMIEQVVALTKWSPSQPMIWTLATLSEHQRRILELLNGFGPMVTRGAAAGQRIRHRVVDRPGPRRARDGGD